MSTPETPRTWRLVFCQDCGEMLGVENHVRVRDEHFGYAGHRGMRFVEAYEAGPVDAERERLLDLIERLLRERDGNAAVAEALGEKLNHEHGDYGSYSRAMDECVSEDPEAEAVLREYDRLGKEES